MTSKHRLTSILSLLILLLGTIRSQAGDQSTKPLVNDGVNRSGAKLRVPFTISKETTYIVQPLDKDGYPDYCSVINQRLSKGVTPVNNAAVPFWVAVGPDDVPAEVRGEFFKLLGMESLPEKGHYFVSTSQFMKRRADTEKPADANQQNATNDAFINDQSSAGKRPWTRKEFPRIAAWLDANEKPLAEIIVAAERPKWFCPTLRAKDGTMTGTLIVSLLPARDVAQALTTRAMLSAAEGRIDDSWRDLLACHRLAVHVAHGPFIVDALGGIMIERIAFLAEQGLASLPRLSAQDAARLRENVNRLKAMPALADTVDSGERYFFLDSVTTMARHRGLNAKDTEFYATIFPEQAPVSKSIDRAAKADLVDWDIVLRAGNTQFDRITDSVRKLIIHRRKITPLGGLDADAKKERDSLDEMLTADHNKPVPNRKRISEAIAHLLCDADSRSLCVMANVEPRQDNAEPDPACFCARRLPR